MRGARALVTTPKLLLAKFPDGLLNCAWLKILKNSVRNSSEVRSVIAVVFSNAKSVLRIPGPWKNRRFALPNVPSVCAAKAPGRKYVLGPLGPGSRGFWI